MSISPCDDDEDNQLAKATATRMVVAGDDNKEDGREADDKADDGQKT